VRAASSVPDRAVRDALVLAAGNGDRFRNPSHRSKLLEPVLGRPLILRTLHSAYDAGIDTFHVVLGYQADAVHETVQRGAPEGAELRFYYNPDWHLENGVSVLAARDALSDRRFALLMGDHLFEGRALVRLLAAHVGADESLLAVDSRPAPPEVAAEATKVRLAGSRITAIGKALERYDAFDTGLFVCAPPLFTALCDSIADGDTTLSGGIRRLAGLGLMRGLDIGDATWYDIDTVIDLESAEMLLTEPGHQPDAELTRERA
jgi:1L-myo-inositol 1-phosphate cytidylyltransferase / CDP-L-myo-inositol myo-inositolphosphotransferase